MALVFIVDDDPIYAKALQRTLEANAELSVRYFPTADECLFNLHLDPDIVTIDYFLGRSNGLELLKKIRAYNENIFTIVITGQNSVQVAAESQHGGARAYIVKGADTFRELENIINKYIHQSDSSK